MATTSVEIDTDLLRELHERSPGKSDRELLEDLALISLGFETIRRAQARAAAANLNQDEIEAEAVRIARKTRRLRAARRAA